jgi:cytochrome c oxidase cbb3-type subunit III
MKPFRLFAFGLLLSCSAPLWAAPDGAKLYAQNCAACHGESGNGGIGIPLSLPSFQSTVDDAYLKRSIRLGRPGRVMPAFTQLQDAEVDAIVQHLRTWYRGKAPRFNAKPVRGNAQHGKALFQQHCAACHGQHGEGGHGTGVTLSRPRDFPIIPPSHNPGFLASASDAMIKHTLITGRAGTPMVAFGKKGLKDRDLNDIVAFVRSLEQQALTPSASVLTTDAAIISMDSPYDLATTIENVRKAVGSNNFVLIREQALNSGLVAEDKEDPKQHIIYFCNFGMLNQALATDPRVGLFLPCRITVVERAGKVRMLAVNPKRLSRIFNNAELNEMCDQITKMYTAIMEEATL